MPSFTWTEADLVRNGPVIEIVISAPRSVALALAEVDSTARLSAPLRTSAMVDTGAEFTVINQIVAQRLDVPQIGSKQIVTPTTLDRAIECPVYIVDLIISNEVTVSDVLVLCTPMKLQNHE